MSVNDAPAARPLLPADGPGSPASWPRRLAAVFLDWLLANGMAFVVGGGTNVWEPGQPLMWLPLACWYVLVVAATTLTGASAGQHAVKIQVIHIHGRRVGPVVAVVRTLLIALVIPPLVFDRYGRGLHDLASDTIVVRTV